MCRPSASSLEYRNVSPGELRDILIATGMDARHASFVVRIEEGIARGDACTDSRDLGRLIRREPTPLAQVIADGSRRRIPACA
jgi:NAD(P)H dehydrogenase (quinone)